MDGFDTKQAFYGWCWQNCYRQDTSNKESAHKTIVSDSWTKLLHKA